LSTLSEIQTDIQSIAARIGPAVVGFGRGWGRGSGVVVARGRVITCAHNLRGDRAHVCFPDGRRAEGEVSGTSPELDLAVVAVDTGDAEPVGWDPAAAASVPLGTAIVALGNPGGRGLRATPGFVASGGRSFRGPRGRRIEDCVEHTAPLPAGSGGGPLVDLDGRLLALNALRLEGGLILALPANELLADRVEKLARGERSEPVRLGVAVAPAHVARRLRRAVGLPERAGVLVRGVADDSPADRAGLARGDLIVSADGTPVDGLDALHRVLDSAQAGEPLTLGLLRGADELELTVTFDATAEAVR
jgi:S1-C subfamily serine protease